MAQAPPAAREREPLRDAERTKSDILEVAMREFAERGYDGARVDEIANQTRTTKRMIYYYFGGKEGLYVAVLARSYAEIRAAEQALDVDHLDPVSAIRTLAELTFDHHESHPEFIRLVANENIHQGRHIAKVNRLTDLNSSAVDLISTFLERGRREGVFRADVDALDVHMMISAICFFRVANRHTFRVIFGRDLTGADQRHKYRQLVGDMVVEYLTSRETLEAESNSKRRRPTPVRPRPVSAD